MEESHYFSYQEKNILNRFQEIIKHVPCIFDSAIRLPRQSDKGKGNS